MFKHCNLVLLWPSETLQRIILHLLVGGPSSDSGSFEVWSLNLKILEKVEDSTTNNTQPDKAFYLSKFPRLHVQPSKDVN